MSLPVAASRLLEPGWRPTEQEFAQAKAEVIANIGTSTGIVGASENVPTG